MVIQLLSSEGIERVEDVTAVSSSTAGTAGALIILSSEMDVEEAYMTLVWQALSDDWGSPTDAAYKALLGVENDDEGANNLP